MKIYLNPYHFNSNDFDELFFPSEETTYPEHEPGYRQLSTNKPYFILRTLESEAVRENLPLLDLASETRVIGKYLEVIITGYRKIFLATDMFFGITRYFNNNNNNEPIEKVLNFHMLAEKNHEHRIFSPKPRLAKEANDYLFTPINIGSGTQRYAHALKNTNSNKIKFFKFHGASRSLADLEACNGKEAFLLDINHPKVSSIYRDGERLGVVSTLLPAFSTFHDKYLKIMLSPRKKHCSSQNFQEHWHWLL